MALATSSSSLASTRSPWTEELRQSLVDMFGDDGAGNESLLITSSDGTEIASPEALDCLEKAIQLDKENSEILFVYCRMLSDVFRQHGFAPLDQPISFGTKRTFGNAGHLRNYLFDQCSRLFELDPISIKYNLGVASLCLSTIPYWARNPQLARLCLERALIFHPESGKALTRMGLYKLNIDKDITSARDYFRKANSYNEQDFGAATSLLYSIFEDIQNYKGEVNVLLKTECRKPFWTDYQRAALYFIRGLFQFFYQGFEKNVAVSWTLAFTLSAKEFEACLERFPRIKSMYRFPMQYDEVFTLANFCEALKGSSSFPEVDGTKLKAVRALIKTVGRKHIKEIKERATSHSSMDKKNLTGKASYESRKSTGMGTYSCLENIIVGFEDNVREAFETFRVPEKTPKSVIISKYRQVCRDLENIKKQPECDQREIANQTFEYNSAFATLLRFFDRQVRDRDAAVAAVPFQDSDEEGEILSPRGGDVIVTCN